MLISRILVGNCNVLFNSYQETRLQTEKFQLHDSFTRVKFTGAKNYIEKRQRWHQITSNQSTFKKTRSLPNSMTNCGFSSPNCTILLDSFVQCDLEEIKHSFYLTENPKFVWKNRGLDKSSQKGYSTPSTPTERASTRCTSTANTKTLMQNSWPLAWYYKKNKTESIDV